MWKILLYYYVEILTIFLQGCENLRVHSNIFASTSKHFLKDMDKIHLKMPIPPKIWLTLIILSLCWIFSASLQNICQLDWIWIISSKYTQKSQNEGKLTLSYTCLKWMFIAECKIICYCIVKLISFELYKQNAVKKANFEEYLAIFQDFLRRLQKVCCCEYN